MLLAINACKQSGSDVESISSRIIKIDTHSHVDVPMESKDMPGPEVDLRGSMEKAGMDGLAMTFAVDYVPLRPGGHALERFNNAIEGQQSIVANSDVKMVLSAKDLEEAVKKHEPFVIQCVEGGHFLEGDVSRVEDAYKQGLRMFCILHDNDADPALGDVYTNEPKFGGLTQLGEDVIAECNRLGILIDLAHCDSTTLRMAIKASKDPVIISHTGLNTKLGSNEFMGKMMYKRLISPELAKEVADAGGLLGVWPHLASSSKEYAENIKAMVDIVGIDHVCIGTDTKITPEYREVTPEMQEEFKKREAERGKNGGEGPKMSATEKNPNAVNHVWADDPMPFYQSVVRELLAIGFSEKEIAKISGGNFIKLFEKVVK
jgi:microsomal dipeptidase-like Zn-dependent dipeptidase